MRVIFYVRCHGEPDDELEAEIENRICDAVEVKERGWGILTIGRQYFHNVPGCAGHPDATDVCEVDNPCDKHNKIGCAWCIPGPFQVQG